MKSKEELVSIFNDTINDLSIGGYNSNNGKWNEFTNPEKGSMFYFSLPAPTKLKPRKTFNTKIYVQNIDTFLKAKEMGPECAVLNMASKSRPGGGVENGSRAQEEDLCRRSNLLQSLYKFSKDRHMLFRYKYPNKYSYPIRTYGSIYSPNVTIYKSSISYNKLDEPYTCSVISVSAVNHPKLDKKGLMGEEDIIDMKGKIRAILRTALIHQHYKIVLGAFGCGAFKCPPSQVAMLFKEVLIDEKEFFGAFEEVCFAILEDKNSLKNNKDGNLKPFKEIFDNVYKEETA